MLRPPFGRRREEDAAREWALEIFRIFGNRLLPRADQRGSSLSYANRRRGRSRARLPRRPKLLLLDEPTAGMNPAETLELAEQIKSLHELGLTILLIEHKLDVVTRLADTVVVLDHGEKIAEGTPEEVRNTRRCSAPISGAAALRKRGRCRATLLEFRRGGHPLRRSACPEGRGLHDRPRRDRLSVGRQCLRQVDDDEDDHGHRAANRGDR